MNSFDSIKYTSLTYIKDNLFSILLFLIISVVIITLAIRRSNLNHTNVKDAYMNDSKIITPQSKHVTVNIEGGIVNPGVYTLEEGKRIDDVIRIAGGFTNLADKLSVASLINKSQLIEDGMKIYIPIEGQNPLPSYVITNTTRVININKDDKQSINSLEGIGDTLSEKIIQGRPYTQIEDLLKRKIITKSVFEKIKEDITI